MTAAARPAAGALAALLLLGVSACGSDGAASAGGSEEAPAGGSTAAAASGAEGGDWTPVTIEHALGTTTIEERPERVATVAWANQEVPLALGVVPVGMAEATFGDDDGDGVLPWVEERLTELGAETPVLFDETDGLDFEAVADTQPDVILAAYSGLTPEDYETLSQIAPVVAYPDVAWGTSWRDTIALNSQGLGMEEEGAALVADLETQIDEAVAAHPEVQGASAMFMTHVDTTDLSTVNFYTPLDTRVAFFADLGMTVPQSVQEASEGNDSFSGSVSAERADVFDDVDVIVTYGGEDLVATLEGDPLLSQIPAVEGDAIVALPSDGPIGTASNPTTLAIPYVLDDYVGMLAEAARAAEAADSAR
ncbi:ABC transporter substrate-binding protein [uncultured Pseudokineococcus sp.]|uniref:ABC transporter substrate-binding protein n=1 Tax=uncultured Pseudokineococcus sp. TaxID=1642928 RepID=UPI0026173526|nr:ABC transporter substrate-binding protein [uncultured Pseudokineococcus sp.]